MSDKNYLEHREDEQEYKEIEIFFDQVETIKKNTLKDLRARCVDRLTILMNDTEIIEVLNKNINLINVISEDTIKIYINTFFEKDGDKFNISEEALETFLTSIMIFKND